MLIAPRESPDTVTACLRSDHERLDRLLEEIESAGERRDLAGIELRFPAFARHLRDHMRFEEEYMFPVVEQALCSAEGPIAVMRHDHQEIEDRLAAMSAAIYLRDLAAFAAEHETLLWILSNHNGREERVLYPAIDRMLDDAARARMVEHIRLNL
jgi:iron-sulfur cluster repair protein YtfE (RIC family)